MKTPKHKRLIHTKGPWKAVNISEHLTASGEQHYTIYGRTVRKGVTGSVADLISYSDCPNPNIEADAVLIAAAPILLKALKALHDSVAIAFSGQTGKEWEHISMIKARKAIAIAEGDV
jgi:hypothetical protein